jgi:hypothetical protein
MISALSPVDSAGLLDQVDADIGSYFAPKTLDATTGYYEG